MNTFTKNQVTFNCEQPLTTVIGKYTLQDYLDKWEPVTNDPLALATEFLIFVDGQTEMQGHQFNETVVKQIIDEFAHNPRLKKNQNEIVEGPYEWELYFSFTRLEKALKWRLAPDYDPTDLITFFYRDLIASLVDRTVYNDLSRMSRYSPRVLELLQQKGLDLILTTSADDFSLFSFEIETDRNIILGNYAGFVGDGENYSVTVHERN